MGRRKLIFDKDSVFHVYNRGCNKEKIFFEPDNYLFLLEKIKYYSLKFNISVIAYCLMPNHYHLLLKQNSNIKLNTFIQHLFNSYTKAINKLYQRSGTLFESRFKAKEVFNERIILGVCRYIHRNPVDNKLVVNIEDWAYSNFPEWIGIRQGKLWDKGFVKKYFPVPDDYKKYVLDQNAYLTSIDELKKKRII